MAKTTFSSGVVLTSKFMNGAQQIFFDDQTNLDWHYPKLEIDSFVLTGATGLDSRYVTLNTQQTVTADKTFQSLVTFDGTNVQAPSSPSTTLKWNNNFANLADDDLLTKVTVSSLFNNLSLNDLQDVNCTPTVDDTILQWNLGTGLWECSTVISGGTY